MLTTQQKKKVMEDFQTKDSDTGSVEVTLGLLSASIQELASHLQVHKKDKHSRRGLITMVSKRRKLLKKLQKKDVERYKALIAKLGLKK